MPFLNIGLVLEEQQDINFYSSGWGVDCSREEHFVYDKFFYLVF